MSTIDPISPEELKVLLQESREIVRDWESYASFLNNRTRLFAGLLPGEDLN